MTHARSLVTALLLLAIVGACGSQGGDPPPARGGGGRPPVTLTLGTPDTVQRPGSLVIAKFVEEVRARSSGGLEIQPRWQAAGPDSQRWDVAVADLVRKGELDMALIPARTWDQFDLTAFDALHAPFLVTSDAAAEAVARDAIATEMLEDLGALDLVGLALWPEQLRHPFALGEPMVRLEDFRGRALRVPASNVAFELMEALGAVPVDLNGQAYRDRAADGTLHGSESEYAYSNDVLRESTATGNITFFTKLNTLVIGEARSARLSAEDRQVLQDSAAAALGVALDQPDDAEAAATFCAEGGRVVLATDADLAALVAAAAPVHDRMQQDAVTARRIERIRELVAGIPAPPIEACGRAAEPSGDLSVAPPDGVYRKTLTQQEMLAAGIDPGEAAADNGTLTLTLDGGRFRLEWDDGLQPCSGSYTMLGDRLSMSIDHPCFGSFNARWTMTEEGLVLSDPSPEIPTLFTYKPWTVIEGGVVGGDPSASAQAGIPLGTYRYDIPASVLRERGLERHAREESGVHTVVVTPGRFVDRWQGPNGEAQCLGTWTIDGDRVTFRWYEGCEGDWSARIDIDGLVLSWSDVEALAPFDSASDQLINETFMSVPWQRVD